MDELCAHRLYGIWDGYMARGIGQGITSLFNLTPSSARQDTISTLEPGNKPLRRVSSFDTSMGKW